MALLLSSCAASVIEIPASLKKPCVSTVGSMENATQLADLDRAIMRGDFDLQVCDARREAVVTIAEAGKKRFLWW